MTVCCVEESQNAADLCALQQESSCPPPPDPPPFCANPPCEPVVPRFCNVEQQCCCVGQGGTEFCYTTPAGTFCAETQEAADAQANAYACENCGNPQTSVRLGALDGCTCLGSTYNEGIAYDGTRPVTWFVIDGELPDGLSLNSFTGSISGTTLDAGTFVFTVKAFLADGNYATRTYSIYVIEITTTALDEYVIGEAYSFQMQAAGGSGNYLWAVSQGSLPTGLTMSSTGLISGTPTAAGSAAIQFNVIDTTCENANRNYFTPLIATTSTSLTTIRTYKGFPAYNSSDTNLYKVATYTGYMTQIGFPYGNDSATDAIQMAGAKYVYNGSDAIDIYGNIISRHTKSMTVMCNASRPNVMTYETTNTGGDPVLFLVPFQSAPILYGYCWPDDPTSCANCETDENLWLANGDWAVYGNNDRPSFMVDRIAGYAPNYSQTATVQTYNGVMNTTGSTVLMITTANGQTPPGFPVNQSFFIDGTFPYISLITTGDWSVTLSSPFTDQEAINSQTQYSSNGRTSENYPNYRTYVQNAMRFNQGRFTDASFTLQCSNLVDGESYTVTYQFWRSDGNISPQTQTFTASGTTHTLFGSLPTPPTNRTITLKNVRIAYT